MALLSALATEIAIPVCAVIGITFSMVQWWLRCRTSTERNNEEEGCAVIGITFSLVQWWLRCRTSTERNEEEEGISTERSDEEEGLDPYYFNYPIMRDNVSKGVKSFVSTEYQVYVQVFAVASAITLFLFLGSVENFSTRSRPCTFSPSNTCKPALATAIFSAVSFLLGAFTSMLCGFLGMRIAIDANGRTALEERNGIGRPFHAAFRSGAIMGFLHAAIGVGMLYLSINLFELYYGNDWEGLFEAITGYGLGGSSMALFGRTAGGIYAKATDVCVHLVRNLPENIGERKNPAVISNYVGDVVGDIAGVVTDLFGSYAESSCVALAVASISSFGIDHDFTAMCYPLLVSSMGILVCFITILFTANFSRKIEAREIKRALKNQLIISTVLMTIGIATVSWIALPSSFTIYNFGSQKVVTNWQLGFCVAVGLWARLIISPLQDVPANNVRFGRASVRIPFVAAIISIFISYSFAATYGIAVAALGILSPIATRLAIDICGPINDNAIRIARTAGARDLDDADNITATIGKGSAIESAGLVSIALFGAFVSRAATSHVDVLPRPMVIIGMIVGAMLPYRFSAMTMKSVGSAGLKMFQEVHRQLHNPDIQCGHRQPDYAQCIKIATDASVWGIVLPSALIMLIPLIVGTFFGVQMLSGVLAGSLGSGVWITISTSNNYGTWNKAKEYIRAGAIEYAEALNPKHPWILGIARSGEIFGDKQDTLGPPPLNILIQLMAVESLVFAPFFAAHGGLLFKIFSGMERTTSPL